MRLLANGHSDKLDCIEYTGGVGMTYKNIVIIDGQEKELEKVTPEEKERLKEAWNRKAAKAAGYEEKTA